MKTRRKLSCYCVTSGTVEQDVSTLGPWYPVSSNDVHLKSRPGRLEDAARVSKYGRQRKPKHIIQSYVTRQTRPKVEYHFSHLSPEEYISSYRDCCSTVSRQGESTVTNEKVKRSPIEVTSILLESPLTLKSTQSHTRPAQQQSVPFTEHWSSNTSIAGIKDDSLTTSHKDDLHVVIDNKRPKPLAIMTSFKYVVTNEFPFYKSESKATSGEISVNRFNDDKLSHSKDHTHKYVNHKNQSRNVVVPTKEYNTLFKDVVLPTPAVTLGNKDGFGRLLTARLKAISDSTVYKDPTILNSTLVSKRLQPSTDILEDINIPTVNSTPNVLHKTVQPHLISCHNCLLINNDSFDQPVLRSSISARVKHRLSLTPPSPTVCKGQSHKPRQMTCFKKSLQRHLSSGKWLFLDRKSNISKSEQRPTLDDILNAE